MLAALPLTRESLTRFVTLADISVTTSNAPQIIGHFQMRRRLRLAAMAIAVPVTGLTNDPLYLVLAWCAVTLSSEVRLRAPVYRTTWLLGLAIAVAGSGFFLAQRPVTAARVAHLAILFLVTAAVFLAAKRQRSLYLGGTAMVLAAAFLTPGQPIPARFTEYSTPRPYARGWTDVEKVTKVAPPTCVWVNQMDDSCRYWRIDGSPIPQAAPYLIRTGGAPTRAPFIASPDKKAVVYVDYTNRRMTHQSETGAHPLTGPLTDAQVPTATFAGQSRYVALVRDGAQIIDTTTWASVTIPAVQRVHDLNEAGIVASTASHVMVVDHRGETLMRTPVESSKDSYNLRPDGKRLVVVGDAQSALDTYDVRTGKRLFHVVPHFGSDFLRVGLGWAEDGRFLVRTYNDDLVYAVDLATGAAERMKHG